MTTDAGVPERVKGMQDLLPGDMDRVRAVEAAFAAACRAWGYREVRTPVIEPLYLFTAAGTLSPKTLDSVYSFLDWDGWSGERVVLRPDSTIPAARLYAEHFRQGEIAKLFYRQNVFRFTDDGSSREEWQCGVELIGDTGLAGDVELVLLAIECLGRQARDISLRVSHAGIVRAVLQAAGLTGDEQAQAYDRLLDGDMAVVDEVEARMPGLNAPLRLLFEVEGAGSHYLANVRSSLVQAIPALARPLDELSFVVAVLEARGVAPVIQAVLARSFEYYSGTIFKIFADGERIVSGGRYDGLLELVGGSATPASGFALYVGAAMAASAPASTPPADSVVVMPADATAAALGAAHALAEQLRSAGVPTQVGGSPEDRVRRVEHDGAGFRVLDGDRSIACPSFEALVDALQPVRALKADA